MKLERNDSASSQLSFPMGVMLTQARERADAGIAQAADATERRIEGWCELACATLRTYAKRQKGAIFTVEIARMAISKKLPPPHDLRAWGRAVRMADARGFIVRVPHHYFPAISSHGSPKPVWKTGPEA